jgi:hypothetical protein
MNRLISITLASLVGGCITVSSQQSLAAQQRNQLPASVAQGKTGETATLGVSPYGIVISFEDLKESIEKYWATDDTYLRIGTNAPLGPDANLLFMKAEGKWFGSSSGTSVTIKTKDRFGELRTYSFLVEFTKNKPKYSIIRIYPDSGSAPSVSSKAVEAPSTQSAPKYPDSGSAPSVSSKAVETPSTQTAPKLPNIPGSRNIVKGVLSRTDPQIANSVGSFEKLLGSWQKTSSSPEKTRSQQNDSQDNNTPSTQTSSPVGQEQVDSNIPPTSSQQPASSSPEITQVPQNAIQETKTPLPQSSQPISRKPPQSKIPPSMGSQPKASPRSKTAQSPQKALWGNDALSPQPSPPITQKQTQSKTSLTPPKKLTGKPSTPRQNLSALLLSHSQANALVRGYTVAVRTGELNRRGVVAARIQLVVRRLRGGQNLMESAKREFVDSKVITRLLQLGNYREPSRTT